MKGLSIDQAVEQSIAAPRAFTSEPQSADELGAEIAARFRAKRIAPEPREILTGPEQLAVQTPLRRLVYFLTDCDPQSVFFDPETDDFGLAWGPEAHTGRYFDEGPRSSDVLFIEHLCQ